MDTSALAKRYRPEIGSSWISGLIEPSAGNVIVISDLTVIELTSVLSRHHREGNLALGHFNFLAQSVIWHASHEYLAVPVDPEVLILSRRLLIDHPLRTLDSIQLACALRAQSLLQEPLTFITADRNLLAAASTERLATDSPLVHP